MGKVIRALMVCVVTSLGFSGATISAAQKIGNRSEPEPEYYIAIVGQPMKIERLDYQRYGNIEPWLRDIIVVSTSCGFVRTTYDRIQLAPARAKELQFIEEPGISVYTKVEEWCRLKGVIPDKGEGLLLGKWDGSYYELLNFELHEAGAGVYIVTPFEFRKGQIEKIKDLFVKLDKKHQICFDTEYIPPYESKHMSQSEFVQHMEGEKYDLCVTHGLPLSRLLEAYMRTDFVKNRK